MTRVCGFYREDPEEVIIDQLDEGEAFWLKGEVWKVLQHEGKLVLCERVGHQDCALLDAHTPVTPKH